MTKKVIVVGDLVREILYEHDGPESIRTVKIIRERLATDLEKRWSASGYGRLVIFDQK